MLSTSSHSVTRRPNETSRSGRIPAIFQLKGFRRRGRGRLYMIGKSCNAADDRLLCGYSIQCHARSRARRSSLDTPTGGQSLSALADVMLINLHVYNRWDLLFSFI